MNSIIQNLRKLSDDKAMSFDDIIDVRSCRSLSLSLCAVLRALCNCVVYGFVAPLACPSPLLLPPSPFLSLHMADSNNPSSQNKRSRISKGNSYVTVTTFLLITLFLFSIFLFNRRSLEPSLSLYRNLLFSVGGGLVAKPPEVGSDGTNLPPADSSSGSDSSDAGADTLLEDNRASVSDSGDLSAIFSR